MWILKTVKRLSLIVLINSLIQFQKKNCLLKAQFKKKSHITENSQAFEVFIVAQRLMGIAHEQKFLEGMKFCKWRLYNNVL